MVYDVTSMESFKHVNDWLLEVNRYAADTTVKLLVGNKCDRDDRVVSTEMASNYADSLNIQFLETSAKFDTNVLKTFETIAAQLISSRLVYIYIYILLCN